MKKLLALLLAAAMAFSLAACGDQPATGPVTSAPADDAQGMDDTTADLDNANIAELKSLNNKEYGTDFISLYEKFGKDVSIADVIEDDETGTAYIERDGKLYTLGLDFLSRAMVYNTAVPEGGDWENEDDVYADWWRLYITRWNQQLPELPLYSNEYYDLYNAEIKGVEEFPTNPYWVPVQALADWSSEKADNSIILGNATELSGKVRYASFGASSPGAADYDIQRLISGLDTVTATPDGNFVWNDTVVAEHSEKDNEDGSRTYTIKLHDDLKFSDGSAITAKNYLVTPLVFSTPVGAQAAKMDHKSGLQLVGFDDFNLYTGAGSAEGKKEFAGIRLIDDLTFEVTFDAQYLPYFYSITYASFSPYYLPMWLGEADIKDDGNGVYLTDDFYAKNGDSYVLADHIFKSAWNTDNTYPYSGMYTIEKYNDADKSCVLTLNPEFKGDYKGTKPSIQKVVYKKVVPQTQLEDFKAGGVDVLSGITGGDATNEAVALAKDSNGKYVYTHYSRAGYGKLGFRADFGPVQFQEVRQAIAYCMDRAKFAKDFTGGYGGVVDGPYYSGSWMYKEAMADGMMLDAYATSSDSAIAKLEEGGWVYNADGSAYTGSGIRYKKISGSEIQENDKVFQSKDGMYKTVQVGDDWYMPLCLNWYGTSENEFSDLLMTGFVENPNLKAAGFNVQYTLGDFPPMLDELYQASVYGFYSGTPLYTCFNFATGYNSAIYDYALGLTIDPAEYDNFSQYYIKDQADAYWLA